jgi:hypothetical protein
MDPLSGAAELALSEVERAFRLHSAVYYVRALAREVRSSRALGMVVIPQLLRWHLHRSAFVLN